MDDTIMEINAKSSFFEDKIRLMKEQKELPKRYLSDFKNLINQIKTTEYDLPKRLEREREREKVKVEQVNEPLKYDVFIEQENKPMKERSPNIDELDSLKQQLVSKDLERQDLIDEFQIKQSRLINQLKDMELSKNQQLARFELEKQQYLLEIAHLKSLNETLKSTYNQLNEDLNELNQFRSKSIDKFIQLKLQIKLQQDEISELKKERVQEVSPVIEQNGRSTEPIYQQEEIIENSDNTTDLLKELAFEKLPIDNTAYLLKEPGIPSPDIPDGTTTQLIKGKLPGPSV